MSLLKLEGYLLKVTLSGIPLPAIAGNGPIDTD